ncbi:hypothetical protein CAP48_04320 [Advenella sp. S44]|uniref:transketolase family protein n=1 Tax=Advenella sp. S44 TaxID=1982755 RepID=UPI000C2AA7EF|nr:transketolase C-terminal domain-containing protein [Advenella sp. S44]PJX25291.1 hypothetical protein CAP48_04320 [Advenella sp. S44]
MGASLDDLKVDDFIARGQAEEMPRAYGDALFAEAERRPELICLCADLVASTETDQIRDRLPDQFVHVGIAEANMMGMAAGMARCGHIAVTHTFSVFSTRRTFDQIAMQVAYPRTNVKMVGFLPGVLTLLGVSHQAIDDIALMRALPNVAIAEPSGPEQIAAIVKASCARPGPVYMRMRRDALSKRPEMTAGDFDFGRGSILREGSDLVVFAVGIMVETALEASDRLSADGIEISVVNMASIKPLDTALVLEQARRCRAVITAENHSIIGGLGSAVAECLAQEGVAARLHRIGLQDTFAEGGSRAFLLQKYGMDTNAIVAAAIDLVKKKDL